MAISSLKQLDLTLERQLSQNTVSQAPPGSEADMFSESLARAGVSLMEPHKAAASAVEHFSNGGNNIHETLIAVEKSDISLKLMMNVRNKLLDAYRQVMQMGV